MVLHKIIQNKILKIKLKNLKQWIKKIFNLYNLPKINKIRLKIITINNNITNKSLKRDWFNKKIQIQL